MFDNALLSVLAEETSVDLCQKKDSYFYSCCHNNWEGVKLQLSFSLSRIRNLDLLGSDAHLSHGPQNQRKKERQTGVKVVLFIYIFWNAFLSFYRFFRCAIQEWGLYRPTHLKRNTRVLTIGWRGSPLQFFSGFHGDFFFSCFSFLWTRHSGSNFYFLLV